MFGQYERTWSFCKFITRCHESGLWTSFNSPPEVPRSPHGLLHYTNCCTSPQTTIPIIHCTDDTHSWLHWSHTLHKSWTSSSSLTSIVVYILAIATLWSPHSCYSLGLTVFSCLIPARVSWINPLPCLSDFVCISFGLLPVYLDYLSALPCWILFTDRRPTLAIGLLCLASSMSVCCVPTNACFMTTPSNKALQMDPHDSRFVTPGLYRHL